MPGIRLASAPYLPNVYIGTAAKISYVHPVHWNRPKLVHGFDFRAKNHFRADSDKNPPSTPWLPVDLF